MKALLKNLALAAVSALSVLILLEVGIRWARVPIGARTDPLSPYGARYLPNSPFVLSDEHPVHGRMNNVGYPDRYFDFDLSPRTRRIGFFGDSFTEAMQVEVDSTFTNVFEDLARDHGIALDAAAFGVAGSGPDQALFRSLHAMHQARFDDVVYVFFQNDFHDCGAPKGKPPSWPYLKSAASGASFFSGAYQWERRGRPLVAALKPFLKESYLLGFITHRLSVARRRQEVAEGILASEPDSVYALFDLGDAAPAEEKRLMERWGAVVRYWKRACDANGVVFRILYIPGVSEVDDSTFTATHRWGTPRYGVSRWMEAFCESEGIPFLNPRPFFQSSAPGRVPSLYWGHLSYAGHRALASYLFEYWSGLLGEPSRALD